MFIIGLYMMINPTAVSMEERYYNAEQLEILSADSHDSREINVENKSSIEEYEEEKNYSDNEDEDDDDHNTISGILVKMKMEGEEQESNWEAGDNDNDFKDNKNIDMLSLKVSNKMSRFVISVQDSFNNIKKELQNIITIQKNNIHCDNKLIVEMNRMKKDIKVLETMVDDNALIIERNIEEIITPPSDKMRIKQYINNFYDWTIDQYKSLKTKLEEGRDNRYLQYLYNVLTKSENFDFFFMGYEICSCYYSTCILNGMPQDNADGFLENFYVSNVSCMKNQLKKIKHKAAREIEDFIDQVIARRNMIIYDLVDYIYDRGDGNIIKNEDILKLIENLANSNLSSVSNPKYGYDQNSHVINIIMGIIVFGDPEKYRDERNELINLILFPGSKDVNVISEIIEKLCDPANFISNKERGLIPILEINEDIQ